MCLAACSPQLEGTSSAPIFELLKLFTYGSWADFKAAPPAGETLSAAQERKLKKLTVVSLASQNKKLSYEVLLTELEMRSVREVEDLLIECIYGGLLHGPPARPTSPISAPHLCPRHPPNRCAPLARSALALAHHPMERHPVQAVWTRRHPHPRPQPHPVQAVWTRRRARWTSSRARRATCTRASSTP